MLKMKEKVYTKSTADKIKDCKNKHIEEAIDKEEFKIVEVKKDNGEFSWNEDKITIGIGSKYDSNYQTFKIKSGSSLFIKMINSHTYKEWLFKTAVRGGEHYHNYVWAIFFVWLLIVTVKAF